jgi:cobalt/nickel transport system ATP-binding protein
MAEVELRRQGRAAESPVSAGPGARPADPEQRAAAGTAAEMVVQVRQLQHTYPDGTLVDFGQTPLEVAAGQRVVLLGPNGAGKSTLLLHILGLIAAQRGEVQVFGQPAHQLRPEQRAQVAALLQQVDEQIIGPTVWDDVAFTPRNLGLPGTAVEQLVERALRRLGIWELRHKVPHAISAGERRKVALAGAVVLSTAPDGAGPDAKAFGPRLFVLDEPFAALDPRSRTALLNLLEELRRDFNTAVLLSTHFVHAVPDFADAVYVLSPEGRIAAHGTPEEVFARPEVLEALDIEPPVLPQLFRSLERRGISLPPPRSVEDAAELLARHCRPGKRRLPEPGRGRPG